MSLKYEEEIITIAISLGYLKLMLITYVDKTKSFK